MTIYDDPNDEIDALKKEIEHLKANRIFNCDQCKLIAELGKTRQELATMRGSIPSKELLKAFDTAIRYRLVAREEHLLAVLDWHRRLQENGK